MSWSLNGQQTTELLSIDALLWRTTSIIVAEVVDEPLSLFRTISQAQGRSLDAQASLFRPGDFLNLHDDKDKGQRICAYTLGLSAHWRPDWGGQLLFHDERDDIKLGLMPRFNTLSVFKVPVRHSVAMVASYARAPRLSITGWFLD